MESTSHSCGCECALTSRSDVGKPCHISPSHCRIFSPSPSQTLRPPTIYTACVVPAAVDLLDPSRVSYLYPRRLCCGPERKSLEARSSEERRSKSYGTGRKKGGTRRKRTTDVVRRQSQLRRKRDMPSSRAVSFLSLSFDFLIRRLTKIHRLHRNSRFVGSRATRW